MRYMNFLNRLSKNSRSISENKRVIATIPPYASFLQEVANHPVVSGFRLNTVMPTNESLVNLLTRLKKIVGEKDLWIDLKCRQIRTTHGFFFDAPNTTKTYKIGNKTYILDPSNPRHYGTLKTPPWAEIEISHNISLDFSNGPIKCWMQDGYDEAYIAEVQDGNKLIMLDGPQRVVGGGESLNILHPSLEIEGYLTDLDVRYIEAAKRAGIHTYMLSYVERDQDIDDLISLDPDAVVVAKIESQKGLEWVSSNFRQTYKAQCPLRLMAARGDLYVETAILRPEKILNPLELIAQSGPDSIVASRILTSLRDNPRPNCSDITDIDCMNKMGYRHFMIGDDICFNEGSLMLGLDILQAILT